MAETRFVLMVMYDLPTFSKEDRKEYRQLVTYLNRSGFYQLQESIYIKALAEKERATKHLAKVEELAAEGSHIRALILTHNNFLKMERVAGEESWGERLINQPKSVISL